MTCFICKKDLSKVPSEEYTTIGERTVCLNHQGITELVKEKKS